MVGVCVKITVLLAVLVGVFHTQLLHNNVMKGTAPWALAASNFKVEDIPVLAGKTMIVTGANTGLGKSNAKFLAVKGATVVMACRSESRCQAGIVRIMDELKKDKSLTLMNLAGVRQRLVPMILDLSSLASVQKFVAEYTSKFIQLDSLVLNAGIMHPPFGLTADGIESQFGVNHLGHFYLTKLLTPLLVKSAPATVVVLSSNGQFMSYDSGVHLNLEDLNNEANYNPFLAYGQSKLCNVLFAQELGEKLMNESVFVNSLNPGMVNTDLLRAYPEFMQTSFKIISKIVPDIFAFEPDTAALTQLYLGTSPEVFEKKITGKYYVPIADPCEPSEHASNKELQKGLWKFSEKLLDEKGF